MIPIMMMMSVLQIAVVSSVMFKLKVYHCFVNLEAVLYHGFISSAL